MSTDTAPRDFNELVTWATWHVIDGITSGRPLRIVMHNVLQGAIAIMSDWKKA